MPRTEYSKAYYEAHKEALKEYNRNKQRAVYADPVMREKKKEQNRIRYNERSVAYHQIKNEIKV